MHAGFGRVSRADVVQGDEPPAFARALGAFDVAAGAHEVEDFFYLSYVDTALK